MTVMNKANLTIRKLTPAIGAELSGIDLSRPLDNNAQDEIYDALIEHQVVFWVEMLFESFAGICALPSNLLIAFGETPTH